MPNSTVCSCIGLRINFSPRSWFEEMRTGGLTEVVCYTRISCSKQSLYDVIFISFGDKNLFTLATLKNSQDVRLLRTRAATKKKDVGAKQRQE